MASYGPILSFIALVLISRWVLGPVALHVSPLTADMALRGQSAEVYHVDEDIKPWKRVGKSILEYI